MLVTGMVPDKSQVVDEAPIQGAPIAAAGLLSVETYTACDTPPAAQQLAALMQVQLYCLRMLTACFGSAPGTNAYCWGLFAVMPSQLDSHKASQKRPSQLCKGVTAPVGASGLQIFHLSWVADPLSCAGCWWAT